MSWSDIGANRLLDWKADDVIGPFAPKSNTWGLAFMRMPHLTQDGSVDPGYWCEGCRFRARASGRYQYGHGETSDFETPEVAEALDGLQMDEMREWPKRGLMQHIHICPGAPPALIELLAGVP
jgi:hypothetical protein